MQFTPELSTEYTSVPRCTEVELLCVLHLRPLARTEVVPEQGLLERLEQVLSGSFEEIRVSSAELRVSDVELCLNELEGDGPFSHLVCDVRLNCTETELQPSVLQDIAHALARRSSHALEAQGYDALAHQVRYTKKMSFMEQGRLVMS
jgi:hypothetical protein